MKTFALIAILVLAGTCSARLIGGKSDIKNTNSLRLQEIFEVARQYASGLTDSEFEPKLTNVLSAQQQVVSGVKYFLEFEMTDTICRKGSNEANNLKLCAIEPKATVNVCNVEVVEQAWLKNTRVVGAACGKKQ
ncbi:L-cystatin [Halotydeus destructor]|nr:L-cystatin [Halotydeus destructor]